MAQLSIQDAFRQQLVDVCNSLIPWPLEFLQGQARLSISAVELLCSFSSVPLRLEFRQSCANLLEAYTVRSLVGTGIVRKFDRAVRHHTGNDFRQVANAIVMNGLADIKRLIEYLLLRRFKRSNKSSGDILDVNDGTPRGSVRLQMNLASGKG